MSPTAAKLPEFNILDHLDRLTVVKELPNEIHAQCPACGEGGFKIDRNTGKYGAFKCGCEPRAIREAVRPLTEAIETHKQSSVKFSKAPKPKSSQATYFVYTDERHQPVARVARIETGNGKKIWQESWTNGAWHKGASTEARRRIHLYRIFDPINQAAIATKSPLHLVEGEGVADLLLSLGIPATTTMGGAGKWRQYGYENYRKDLESCENLVLCPDRDKPGVAHMREILEDFPRAMWLHADPNHPAWSDPTSNGDAFDVGDWVRELQRQGMTGEAIALLLADSTTQPPKADAVKEAKSTTDEKLCPLAANYQALKKLLSDRLRLNTQTKDIELDGQPVTIERLELDLALKFNKQFKSLPIITRGLAEENQYSPVVEYLDSVYAKFGDDRSILKGIAQRYFGRSEGIFQIFLEKWLTSAVARAYEPGCKVDTALILQGLQGSGKSTFFKVLASEKWFDDSLGDVSDKDERLKLHRVWISEWSELEVIFKKKDVSSTKAFLSCASDNIRLPYGRSVESMPRQSVIVGTTNQDEFLSDPTGNRRFWVVPVNQTIDIELLRAERDRIWAAAVSLYNAGASWWLTKAEEGEAAAIAEEFSMRDPWIEAIQAFLIGRNQVATGEVLSNCLSIELSRQDKASQMRVADCLKKLGWQSPKSARVHNGKRQRVWTAPVTTQPAQPDSEVVSKVVRAETLDMYTSQDERHNLHNLLPKKTDFDDLRDTPTGNDQQLAIAENDQNQSFTEKGCVGRVDSQNSYASTDSACTTSVQPPDKGCVDALKVGDRVRFANGEGVIQSLEDDGYRIEGEGFYIWQPKELVWRIA